MHIDRSANHQNRPNAVHAHVHTVMAPVGSPAQVSFLQKVQKTKAIDPSALFDQVVKSKAFNLVGGRGLI